MTAARAGLISPRQFPDDLLDRVHDLLPSSIASATEGEGYHGFVFTTTIEDLEAPQVRRRLRELCAAAGADSALTIGDLAEHGPELVVLDVDSTFITAEAIELLAVRAGSADTVAAITDKAMRGELDFAASLTKRVATLAGLPERVLADVAAEVRLSPGAAELVRVCHERGVTVGLVSGGFHEIVDPLAASLDIGLVRANRLETAGGRLTGRTRGAVVDRAAKAAHLREYATARGVAPERVVAIGDGANDLDMLAAAGLGVAYCAKPVTRAAAEATISFPRLDAVRVFAGL